MNTIADTVLDDVVLEGSKRLWIEVVGVDGAALLAGREGKGADAGKHVADHIVVGEALDNSLVLVA